MNNLIVVLVIAMVLALSGLTGCASKPAYHYKTGNWQYYAGDKSDSYGGSRQ